MIKKLYKLAVRNGYYINYTRFGVDESIFIHNPASGKNLHYDTNPPAFWRIENDEVVKLNFKTIEEVKEYLK